MHQDDEFYLQAPAVLVYPVAIPVLKFASHDSRDFQALA